MYIVTGASGQTGYFVASYLLKKGLPVRVILRDPKKAAPWKELGVDVYIGDLTNASSLIEGFKNATAAYLINPPAYHSDPIEQASKVALCYAELLQKTDLRRVVLLSSMGAHIPTGTGMIQTTRILEKQLEKSLIPHIFLRPSFFMENWKMSLQRFSKDGFFPSFLAPLDRPIRMVSVQDVGTIAAKLLIDEWRVSQVVGLDGPKKYSPLDCAAVAAKMFNRQPNCIQVPEKDWQAVLSSQNFSPETVEGFCEMYKALNDGKIVFDSEIKMKGEVSLENAFQTMFPLPVTL